MALNTEKETIKKKRPEEQILVIKRELLFPCAAAKQGFFLENLDTYLTLINQKKEFLPRSIMEQDPYYKQIIPYLIFSHICPKTNIPRYFLMQRTDSASEKRLRNKYSLGIGGHIRQEDLSENSIFAWAHREFHEEVSYSGSLSVKPLGILNDDSNEVGTVHLGLVLLLQGGSGEISIKSELKSGSLFTLEQCANYAPDMENWSALVFDYLRKNAQ